MEKINVLVTAAGGGGHGNSITKAINNSRLDINLVAADMSGRLINTADADKKLIIPGAGNAGYIDALRKIIKEHSIHAWFTGCEQELDFVGANRDSFTDLGVKIFLNDEKVIKLCKNKFECGEFLAKNGVRVPVSIVIDSLERCSKVDFFPCVVKPYVGSGASANVYVCGDLEELRFISTYLLKNNVKIIAQEYIPYSDNEYTAGVTSHLENGTIVDSIVMKRYLEGFSLKLKSRGIVISSGISQGEFVRAPEINAQCRRIAELIGSKGPLNIQLRVVDGVAIPFEINPRFSGTTSARAFDGYNEPEFFIRKYVLNDETAVSALNPRYEGYVIKGLDERYVKHER